jgi:hypothetical protein
LLRRLCGLLNLRLRRRLRLLLYRLPERSRRRLTLWLR